MAKYVNRAELRKMQDFHLLLLSTLKAGDDSKKDKEDLGVSVSALAQLTNELHDTIEMPPGTDLVNGPSLVRVKDWPPTFQLHVEPRPISEYWDEWMKFMALWFALKRENGFNTCHQATWCIHQAIVKHEGSIAPPIQRDLVRRLWSDRWLLHELDAVILLTTYEASEEIAQDANRLSLLRNSVGEKLKSLKSECGTLNEWFEGLREIAPSIMQGYRLALSERDNATHRWFDEMQADLAGVLKDTLTQYEDKETLLEDRLRMAAWEREITVKRALRFQMNARISFPRFWYEGALSALEGQGVAPEIVTYDVPAAVACAIACNVERFHDSLQTSAMLRRHRRERSQRPLDLLAQHARSATLSVMMQEESLW